MRSIQPKPMRINTSKKEATKNPLPFDNGFRINHFVAIIQK